MKRTLLTLVFCLQFVLSFAQSTNWGQWQTTAGFKGLQFRTRHTSTNADDFNQYIQFRNNYTKKVAFSYVVQNTSKEVNNYIIENGGQYRTEMAPNETSDGLMWISLKNANTPYLAVGYLRFLQKDQLDISEPFASCDDHTRITCLLCSLHPRYGCGNYDKAKNKTQSNKDLGKSQSAVAQSGSKQNKNAAASNSLSVEALENIILLNLKLHLKLGRIYNNIDNYAVEYDSFIIDKNGWVNPPEPNTLYINYHTYPASNYYFNEKFAALDIDKRISQGTPLLHFKQKWDYDHGTSDYVTALFLYDFGENDANYLELKNAIDALKNGQNNNNSLPRVNTSNEGAVPQQAPNNNIAPTETTKHSAYTPSAKRLKAKHARNQFGEFDGDFNQFLSKQVRYPAAANENNIQGLVVVSFVIGKDGSLRDIKAISGPPELYESAVDAIRLSDGMWIPARQNNRFVNQILSVPISYHLSD